MKLRHLLISVPTLVLVPAGALAARSSPVEPGGKIGEITLVSLPEAKADYEIFQFCRPDILKPGRYKRSCTVPHTKLLFVGYGDFETTRAKLGMVWRQIHWTMSLDGRPVDLRRFGTEDRVLPAYPPAGGKTAYLRLWTVMAEDVSPGQHTLRYVSRQSGFGTIDVTWTFVVPKR
jgi:hypothetical protein